MSTGCCGCEPYDKYQAAIKPYKERNILEYARQIKKLHEVKKQIAALQEPEAELKKSLPAEIIALKIRERGEK